MKPKDINDKKVEFLVMIRAFDETFSQTSHTRSSYKFDETIFGARFKLVTEPRNDGSVEVALNRLSEVEMVNLQMLTE